MAAKIGTALDGSSFRLIFDKDDKFHLRSPQAGFQSHDVLPVPGPHLRVITYEERENKTRLRSKFRLGQSDMVRDRA
jgi:hypothetical protein